MPTWCRLLLASLVVAASAAAASAQCATTSVASGLKGPSKVIVSPKGNLLVAESGDGANAGRISIVAPDGARRTLVDGLPSGTDVAGGITGPTGLVMRGRTLYVLIGSGDEVVAGGPGIELPNPTPSSPIFSSVLQITFSAAAEKKTNGFTLTAADHQTLQDGGTLRLKNRGKDRITMRLVVDLPDYAPRPLPDVPDNVSGSNPYGIDVLGDALYVVDASLNTLVRVDVATGTATTMVEFPSVPNVLPFGPPVVDSVPDSIRVDGGALLVTHLTGFPFGPGAAFVSRIDPSSGQREDFIGGLTAAIDLLPAASGGAPYVVLEFSTNLIGTPPGPGRLLRFQDPAGPPEVVLDCLVTPTSMARDPRSGAIYVTQLATGELLRVDVP